MVEKKNMVLERILEISVEKKVRASSLAMEFIEYRRVGLTKKVALDYLNMKYNNDGSINEEYK